MSATNDETLNASIYSSLDDAAIVKDIAHEVKRVRVKKNISQHKMADITGLDRVTISRFENGRAATLLTFVQILRSLEQLEFLEKLKQVLQASSIADEIVIIKTRQRASKKREKAKE